MKKLSIVFLCLILASFIVIPNKAAYSQARTVAKPTYVEGEMLVKLKAEATDLTDEDIPALLVHAPGARVEHLGARNSVHGINLVHLDGQTSVEQAVADAQADPRVEYAEPNYIYKTTTTQPNDPLFSAEWGLLNSRSFGTSSSATPADIGATKAWDITTGSDDVVVAVIDAGIDTSHEDLAANVWNNPGEIPGNGVDDDGDGFVDDVHGWNFVDNTGEVFKSADEDFHATHVAGTIGAVSNNGIGVSGIAWHVRLMSLKFIHLNKKGDGTGSTANAIAAIGYAVDQKLHHNVNVRVINASWGGPGDSQALRDAIKQAGDAGIVFVCSAGNDSINNDGTDPDFPGAYAATMSNIISVAAIDQNDQLANFSNFGHKSTTVAAPGVNIMSTFPNNNYRQISGTSMASPHVAGVVALLLSNEPNLTPAQVKQRLIDTAEPTDSLISSIASSGRVNAYNALTNTKSPVVSPRIVLVTLAKTTVTVDGVGFVNGSGVIEIDGKAATGMTYDNSFAVGNGTLTRVVAAIGKKPLKKSFPVNQTVNITVFNPTTGERSAVFPIRRF